MVSADRKNGSTADFLDHDTDVRDANASSCNAVANPPSVGSCIAVIHPAATAVWASLSTEMPGLVSISAAASMSDNGDTGLE